MKWWIISSCLLMTSCGNQPEEKAITSVTKDTITNTANQRANDTATNFEKDTASHASFTVPVIKTPSGIWEFVMPYDAATRILHTISFSNTGFRLQEEYLNSKDSVVITEGTWAPSQGFIWLYKEQLVRGRYIWNGDTLQYFSPRLNKKFSMTKLTPVSSNPVWQTMRKQGAVLYGVGTEPFWSVEVKKKDSIILNMPDLDRPVRVKLAVTNTENKTTTYSAAATDSLQVTVSPYFCSDGMSDFTYTSKIIINYKGRTLQGCGVMF